MSWDRTGTRIRAIYLGQAEVRGIVASSRVKYGGKVCHTMVLDHPFQACNGAIRYNGGDRIIVDEEMVVCCIDDEFDSKLRNGRFKTAYSPLYQEYVGINRVYVDDHGDLIIAAHIAWTPDDEEVLFRPDELTNYVL